jgi:hypothetical protein
LIGLSVASGVIASVNAFGRRVLKQPRDGLACEVRSFAGAVASIVQKPHDGLFAAVLQKKLIHEFPDRAFLGMGYQLSLRSETKTRRIANLLTITANHREIWKEFLNNPKLARVRDVAADIVKQPVTDEERLFVIMVILHISSAYYAMKDGLVVKLEGLRGDVAQILARPVPNAVWEKIKQFQNDDFVAFVESCRNWK